MSSERTEELERIEKAYEERKQSNVSEVSAANQRYTGYAIRERDKLIKRLLKNTFTSFKDLTMIEIGAGLGGNIFLFNELGIPWDNIWANELLADRVQAMRENLPDLQHVEAGDACELDYKDKFDLVFLSTVLTSILDTDFKKRLSNKILDVTKPAGSVLIYDFVYDNPRNANVKGVGKKELASLFDKAARIEFHKTTVAPPIGRRIGGLYPIFNALFPFLRTHLLTIITK